MNATDSFLVTIQYGKGPHYIQYMGDDLALARSIQHTFASAPKKSRTPVITARVWKLITARQQDKYPSK